MTRSSATFWILATCALAACGGRPIDEFTRGTNSIAQGGTGGAAAGSAGLAPPDPHGGGAGLMSMPEAGAPSEAGQGGDATPDAGAGGMGAQGGTPPVPQCSAEICNGRDDDCDGRIDEGCPLGLFLGNAIQRSTIGDSFGGTDFADTCADDELLVGLEVGVGAVVDRVTGVCQRYALGVDEQVTPYRYSVALGDKRMLATHPEAGASPVQELECRAGTVMVGVRVSQQHSALGDPSDVIVIPRLWIECAAPSLALEQNSSVVWENVELLGPISGSFANDQAWFEADRLAVAELLVGFHGAAGGWIDRVGLTASPLQVSLQSE